MFCGVSSAVLDVTDHIIIKRLPLSHFCDGWRLALTSCYLQCWVCSIFKRLKLNKNVILKLPEQLFFLHWWKVRSLSKSCSVSDSICLYRVWRRLSFRVHDGLFHSFMCPALVAVTANVIFFQRAAERACVSEGLSWIIWLVSEIKLSLRLLVSRDLSAVSALIKQDVIVTSYPAALESSLGSVWEPH